MKTFILPGFSPKNKDWAYQTKESLVSKFPTEVIDWKHWKDEGEFDLQYETKEVIHKIGNEEVNIISKSIGTWVLVHILNNIKVNKVILCGLPLNDLSNQEEKDKYKILGNLDPEKILCIQNENDNHGSFADVEKFIHTINPKIKVISKPRDDHDYPYVEEFEGFLEK